MNERKEHWRRESEIANALKRLQEEYDQHRRVAQGVSVCVCVWYVFVSVSCVGVVCVHTQDELCFFFPLFPVCFFFFVSFLLSLLCKRNGRVGFIPLSQISAHVVPVPPLLNADEDTGGGNGMCMCVG
jgi:hypothetical protein